MEILLYNEITIFSATQEAMSATGAGPGVSACPPDPSHRYQLPALSRGLVRCPRPGRGPGRRRRAAGGGGHRLILVPLAGVRSGEGVCLRPQPLSGAFPTQPADSHRVKVPPPPAPAGLGHCAAPAGSCAAPAGSSALRASSDSPFIKLSSNTRL